MLPSCNLCFRCCNLRQRTTYMHCPGLQACSGLPGNRAIKRKIYLERAGAVAKALQAMSIAFRQALPRYPQQLAEQREQALGQFSSELTQQRDAGIRQMTTSLQQEQQAFVSNLEGAADRWADHLVGRLAAVALILLLLSVMGVFVYRRLSRRREARTIGASAPLRYSAPELDLPERARRGTL